MSKIFSLTVTVIEEKDCKKKIIFQNQLKKLNFDKSFEDVIENELDFHHYGTEKIEIQQQLQDISPLMCELHQTMFDVLDFKPALKTITGCTPPPPSFLMGD